MTIKNKIALLILSLSSFQVMASPATDQQVQELVQLENWNQLKSALIKNGLPTFKSSVEDSLIEHLQIPQPISAQNQLMIMQISDITVNDTVDQINEAKLIQDISQAYKRLSSEEIAALIELYKKPNMQNAAKKSPILIAQSIDQATEDFTQLLHSNEIINTVKKLEK